MCKRKGWHFTFRMQSLIELYKGRSHFLPASRGSCCTGLACALHHCSFACSLQITLTDHIPSNPIQIFTHISLSCTYSIHIRLRGFCTPTHTQPEGKTYTCPLKAKCQTLRPLHSVSFRDRTIGLIRQSSDQHYAL